MQRSLDLLALTKRLEMISTKPAVGRHFVRRFEFKGEKRRRNQAFYTGTSCLNIFKPWCEWCTKLNETRNEMVTRINEVCNSHTLLTCMYLLLFNFILDFLLFFLMLIYDNEYQKRKIKIEPRIKWTTTMQKRLRQLVNFCPIRIQGKKE